MIVRSTPAPRALTSRFDEAFQLAHDLHRDQRRKGTDIPYIAHLLAVTSLVLEHGGDEDEAIAALLHDAVEDAGGAAALASVTERFGSRVATIVVDCSDTDETPKPPWRPRKEKYLAHLAEASPSALLIAGADRLHNLRSLLSDLHRHGETTWEKFNAPRAEQLWFFHGALDAMRGNPGHRPELLRELEATVALVEVFGSDSAGSYPGSQR